LWRNFRARSRPEQIQGLPFVILKGPFGGWRATDSENRFVCLRGRVFPCGCAFHQLGPAIAKWLAHHLRLEKLRAWIQSLPPYPSLALFSIPVIILEPVKPLAAYLAATGQLIGAAAIFVVGELLKLVLVERLFALTRNKLMKIPAFAWIYAYYKQAIGWLRSTQAWQTILALKLAISERVRAWRAQFRHLAVQRGR
jgi:hypothetical protein